MSTQTLGTPPAEIPPPETPQPGFTPVEPLALWHFHYKPTRPGRHTTVVPGVCVFMLWFAGGGA